MAPVADATVALIPSSLVPGSQSVQPLEDLAATAPYRVTTDAAGAFQTKAPPGRYFVFVTPDPNDARNLPGGRTTLAGGTKASKPPTTIASVLLSEGQETVVDVEVSETPSPAATYVGSTRCKSCHDVKLTVAGQNLHFLGLRKLGWMGSQTTNVQDLGPWPNADAALTWFADGNPNDNTGFGDGFGYLHVTPEGYGVYLGKSFLTHYVYFTDLKQGVPGTLLSERYDVVFGYGGEGQWRMLFVTRLDATGSFSGTAGLGNYHVLPIQFNDAENRWVDFRPEGWGPPVTDGGPVGTFPGLSDSWDMACGGCHANDVNLITGTLDDHTPHLSAVTDAVAGPIDIDGDWSMDEINLGCERCHGPGSEHLKDKTGGSILHPYKLAPGRSVLLCGQCHQRGAGLGTFKGAPTAYASRGVDAGLEFWRAGGTAAEFYGTVDGRILPDFGVSMPNGFFAPIDLRSDESSWQDASGGFGSKFDSAKGYGQQYFDHVRGTHFANETEILTCSSCHAGHHLVLEHQLRADPRDNVLCLECHAEKGEFVDITQTMVADVKAGSAPDPQIATSVHAHMAWKTFYLVGVAMNLKPSLYDPTNDAEPVGRCTSCHMPQTALQAAWDVDSQGYTIQGDSSSHLMQVVSPDTSEAMAAAGLQPVINSCASCHGKPGTAWPDYRY